MSPAPHEFLSRAIEAARRALRDLDGDQVPADLRRVAAHSGLLPPPLATSLLKGLDRYEWLREKALESWPEADPDEPGLAGLAAAYLCRPPGWSTRLMVAYADQAAGDAVAESSAGSEALAETQRRLEEGRRRLREARAEADRRVRDVERRLEEAQRARRSLQAGLARDDAEVQASLEELRVEVAALQSRLEASDRLIRELREELRRERRERADAEAAASELAATGGLSAIEPEDLAGRLDQMMLMARAPARRDGTVARVSAGSFGLPAGVRPDGEQAIEWLVSEAPPVTVLVDGYNAGFLLIAGVDPVRARGRLEVELSRLITLAAGRLAAVVVYDSVAGEVEEPTRRGGVEVLFTAGRSADDVLVELVGGLGGRLVVISNDRALRERAEPAGAVALWSDSLRAWSMRG